MSEPYVLERTERERERLDLQGLVYGDITRRTLVDAGITPGMRDGSSTPAFGEVIWEVSFDSIWPRLHGGDDPLAEVTRRVHEGRLAVEDHVGAGEDVALDGVLVRAERAGEPVGEGPVRGPRVGDRRPGEGHDPELPQLEAPIAGLDDVEHLGKRHHTHAVAGD